MNSNSEKRKQYLSIVFSILILASVPAMVAFVGTQPLTKDDSGAVSAQTLNGTVYVGANNNKVYAIDAETGTEKWTFGTSERVRSSPTVVGDTVFVGSYDSTLYAIDAGTGTEKWAFTEPSDIVRSSPTVVGGTVFIGSDDNKVYAIDAETGSKKWDFQTSDNVRSSPTVKDGTVFVGSYDNNVYAIDAETGSKKWEFPTSDSVRSSPTVMGGTVFVGSNDNSVYAIDAETGSKKWEFTQSSDTIFSSPTAVNGTVFVGSRDETLYAIDAETGAEKWAFTEPSNSILSSPTVVNETVFVASGDNYVYAIDAKTGSKKWDFYTSDYVSSSPTVKDGVLFIGSNDRNVYAIDAETGTEKWSFYTSGLVLSSPTYVSGGSSQSDGSRVMLQTLGHHKAAIEPSNSLSIQVTDQNGNQIGNVSISIKQNSSEIDNGITDGSGVYSTTLDNGTYTLTASKSAYEDITKEFTVSGDTSIDVILNEFNPEFKLHVPKWMNYTDTATYSVRFDDNTVTENATVTSSNITVLTVNSTSQKLEATNNESLAARVQVNATYTHDGKQYRDTKNVTVAPISMEYIDLHSPFYSTIAVIGNTVLQYIIFIVIIAIGVAKAINPYAGIGTIVIGLMTGWIAGWVNLGVLIAGIFFGIFLILNSNVEHRINNANG